MSRINWNIKPQNYQNGFSDKQREKELKRRMNEKKCTQDGLDLHAAVIDEYHDHALPPSGGSNIERPASKLTITVDAKNLDIVKGALECLFYAVSLLEGESKDKALARMAEKGLVDIG